jgi:hypothetical protein
MPVGQLSLLPPIVFAILFEWVLRRGVGALNLDEVITKN